MIDVGLGNEEVGGVEADDGVGFVLPNKAHQLLAQGKGGFDQAVMVAQEDTCFDPGDFGRFSLFIAPGLDELISGHLFFMAANVAVGDHDVDDFAAMFGPQGGRSTRHKFNIIRVGKNKHRPGGNISFSHPYPLLFPAVLHGGLSA